MKTRLKCDPWTLPVPKLAPTREVMVDRLDYFTSMRMSFAEARRRAEEYRRKAKEKKDGTVCGYGSPGSDGPGVSCDGHGNGTDSKGGSVPAVG